MSPRPSPSHRRPNRKDQARIERRRRAAEIRRRQTPAPTAAPVVAPRSRRPVLAAAAIAVVAVIAAIAVVLAVADDDETTIDPSLTAPLSSTPGGGDWVISDAPEAYRIVYRHDRYSGTEVTTTTDEYTVRRPFQSLVVTKLDAPPGGAMQSVLLNNYGTFMTQQGTTEAEATAPASSTAAAATSTSAAAPGATSTTLTSTTVPPASPPTVYDRLPAIAYDDVRLDAALPDLVASGIYVPRERRVLLGRECQVFRTGEAVESRAAAKPTPTDYTDACIDRAGLLVEEVTVTAGKVTSHLTAIEIDTGIDPGDEVFAVTGEPSPPEEGGSVTDEIGVDEVPVPTYWVPQAAPDGYEHRGRSAMRQVQREAGDGAATNEDGTPKTITSYADVYVSGTRTIVVTQGPSAAADTSIADEGDTVRLGGLGVGRAAAGPQGSGVIARPGNPGDWFVKIDATMSTDELVAFARTMRTVAGPPAPADPATTATAPPNSGAPAQTGAG